jgi:hypothetical protein
MERKDTRDSYCICHIEGGVSFHEEKRIYLQRKADGISAEEGRTLIDNNRQRVGRDTTFQGEYHDGICSPNERDELTDISP